MDVEARFTKHSTYANTLAEYDAYCTKQNTIVRIVVLDKNASFSGIVTLGCPGRPLLLTKSGLASTSERQTLANSKDFLVLATIYMLLHDLMH